MSTESTSQRRKLTKTVVDRMVPPAEGQAFIRDAELKGFGLRVTASGTKTFIVEKRVKGRVRRISLGRYGELTAEQARKEAQKVLGQIATGLDPAVERRRARLRGKTLAEAFEDFLGQRELKPRTRYEYTRLMATVFRDWQGKSIAEIDRTMVASRHKKVGETNGEARANLAMRFLRSLLAFAQATYITCISTTAISITCGNPCRTSCTITSVISWRVPGRCSPGGIGPRLTTRSSRSIGCWKKAARSCSTQPERSPTPQGKPP